MTDNVINQVVIVGGGTAGWLTASILAKKFDSRQPGAIQVTLIESPDIPTIGVGEGTWPTMRKTLAKIGISETDFLLKCNASLKQGTKFVNWKSAPENGVDHAYYHLFTSMFDPEEFNLAPYWSLDLIGQGKTYAETVSVQGLVSDDGLSPKTILNKEFEGVLNYAYHLDAGLFAQLLTEHATKNLGVKHISANVEQVLTSAQGDITGVHTDRAGLIEGDFFVDCSGFKALLIDKTLNVPFNSVADTLLTDHALAIQVPYQDEQTNIASCTVSTAHEAGWTWDIGLSNRRGTGYVYSSAHVDHETAEKTLRNYIGTGAEQLDSKLIKMNVGYREKFWEKNCVAIGLSAAFVEPLEASAIFLIEASANMVSELFPRQKHLMSGVAQKFNDSMGFRWQKTVDFIKMHYFLSERQESFWRDNKELNTVPDSLLALLDRWRCQALTSYDFDNVFEPFPMESYQYVLHGMGFKQDLSVNKQAYANVMQAKQYQQQVQMVSQKILGQLPSNREILNKIKEFGLQSI